MTVLYSVLPFLGMLVALIVAHELGHYFTAKLFRVKVLEAGLGYPPRIWGFEWRGTIYSINWLPLGGFVRLLGEEDPSDPESLAAQPAWKRLIVLFAGSGMNLVLPVLLFAVAFMIPRDVPLGPAGIRIANRAATIPQCTTFTNPPPECKPTERQSYNPLKALGKGWTSTWDSLTLARNQIISIFHGGSGPDVAGPVGIAQATGEVVKESGWQTLLDFAALLSINLAIINVLPLPMLDGGRMAFVILEVIRGGRRIAPEKEAIVHLVGLALIITMAVVVTYFDILRIISGGSLFD